jgi:hypothetical protein
MEKKIESQPKGIPKADCARNPMFFFNYERREIREFIIQLFRLFFRAFRVFRSFSLKKTHAITCMLFGTS